MKHYMLIVLAAVAFAGCRSFAKYPMAAPSADNMDDRLVGKWKLREDTNSNNFYEVYKSSAEPNVYHIRFWDRGGKNPTYETELFVTKVGMETFLNVGYFEPDFVNTGYFFLRVLRADADFNQLTAATVADTTLRYLHSKEEVGERIAENVHRAAFYSDTVHLYKAN